MNRQRYDRIPLWIRFWWDVDQHDLGIIWKHTTRQGKPRQLLPIAGCDFQILKRDSARGIFFNVRNEIVESFNQIRISVRGSVFFDRL